MPGALVWLVAETPVLLVPAYLVYLALNDRAESLFTFYAVFTAWILSYSFGMFYYHPVPAGGVENAFPSQHATVVFAAFWSALYYRREKLAVALGVAAVLTGVGRVLAGFHYPVDIVGGAFAGLVGLGLLYVFEDRFDVAVKLRKIKEKWF